VKISFLSGLEPDGNELLTFRQTGSRVEGSARKNRQTDGYSLPDGYKEGCTTFEDFPDGLITAETG